MQAGPAAPGRARLQSLASHLNLQLPVASGAAGDAYDASAPAPGLHGLSAAERFFFETQGYVSAPPGPPLTSGGLRSPN